MNLKTLSLAFCFACSLAVSAFASDITITQQQWQTLKTNLSLLESNNEQLQNTLESQTKQIEKLQEQLKKSQEQTQKALSEQEQTQKSLESLTTSLKKSRSKTIGVGVTILDNKVRPTITYRYNDFEFFGNTEQLGVLYYIY